MIKQAIVLIKTWEKFVLCWLFALSDLPNACYLLCQAGVGFV
jgi:hypothetical protein